MKTLLNTTFLLLTVFLLTSCQKREEPTCKDSRNADLIISNISQHTFDIYIDDNLIYRLHGGLFTSGLTITEGERIVKALQVSGIENEPLEITLPIDVVRCEEYIWQIP